MSTDFDRLVELLGQLDAPLHRYGYLQNYFDGNSPLSYLPTDAKAALAKFDRVSSNLCRTAVLSIGERLRLAGFDGHPDAWPLAVESNLDQRSSAAHQRALLFSTCPILVWADGLGRIRATVEDPRALSVQRDPVTGEVLAGVKRVHTSKTTEAWAYLPDEVQHWRADSPSAAWAGFRLLKRTPNPVGVVPIATLGSEDDQSVIADLIDLQNMLNKLLLDAMVASEYAGRPRRHAAGIELVEVPVLDDDGNETGDTVTENPFPEFNRMMISENENAKFGQLPAADLGGFEAGVRVVIAQAMMVSGLPAHYVGLLQDSVTSADALRAAESALVARVEQKQRTYGLGWERVAQLLVGMSTGTHPDEIDVRVKWSPADTRSQAQEADSAQKLFAAGILSRRTTLKRLGFTDDEIAAELRNLATETTHPSTPPVNMAENGSHPQK
jgi:hypothetical protein